MTVIQKYASSQKPLEKSLQSFHLPWSVSWDSSVASGWKCKAGGTWGWAMLPWTCWDYCKTMHSSLWSSLRDWQIWGVILKALCENRQQNAPHGVHVLAEQRERGHQKDGLMQSLSRSETHYGALNFAALLSQLEKGRPSKKVIRCSVASHWCNTWTVFQLPHCHSFTKPIGDAGTELYNLSYEICLEHASTSCNLS